MPDVSLKYGPLTRRARTKYFWIIAVFFVYIQHGTL